MTRQPPDKKDEELRAALQEILGEARHAAPPFSRMWRQAERRRDRRRPRVARMLPGLVASAAVLLAVMAVVVLMQPKPPSPASFESLAHLDLTHLGPWQGPLDFLLDVPGHEVLATTPTIPWTPSPYPELAIP
jgi:hypothetical protein